jgi:virginiamycin B lyase
MQRTTKILFAGLLVGWWALGGTAAQAQGLPDGEGKEAIQASCNLCHGLNYITQSSRSAAEWRNLVSDMVSRGAPLTKDEFETVLQYLATHFGPKSSSEPAKSN